MAGPRNPFGTVRTEGGLLPVGLLRRIATRDHTLFGIDDEAYHLSEDRKLGEAINESWNRLTAPWWAFRSEVTHLPEGSATTALTREKWLLPLFAELGFGRLAPTKSIEVEGTLYPVSHVWHTVPLHLVGWDVDLDTRTSGVAGAARRSPHSLVQELLNRSEDYLWGAVTNGRTLRLLRDNVTLTRQSYVEFDLEAMMNGEIYGDFALLWLLLHESRFEAAEPRNSIVEHWARQAEEQGVRALDRLRDGVERALVSLGAGYLSHPANEELRRWLQEGSTNQEEYYRELLRFVYRLLFLLVCEDRELIPDPAGDAASRHRYLDHYSVDRLRSLAQRRLGGSQDDLIRGFRIVVDKLGTDEGCLELALPALGGSLWSESATPHLDSSRISNHHFLSAIRALTITDGDKAARQVDFANLGSEELGSIYESLLELHAQLTDDGFILSTAAGHERRTTGSYYTPTSLIAELLNSALDPVLDEASGSAEPERAILDLKVCDPAAGSGHFLVAAGHRIARRLASIRTGDEEPSPEATRTAIRDVVSHCLYGIDINPMAVELCKVSLWMEAMDPGSPLSFLDHHIVCGNSLLGATPRLLAEGIPDDAFKPIQGDDRKVAAELRKRNKAERKGQATLDQISSQMAPATLAQISDELEKAPERSVSDVTAKEAAWRQAWRNHETEDARRVADAWCAAFVIPKKAGKPILTQAVFETLIRRPNKINEGLRREIDALATRYRFLHPHLAFPGVFKVPSDPNRAENLETGWDGGFDVILGNPPWERVKLQEKEWFAGPRPDIAGASSAATRGRMIKELVTEDPLLSGRWFEALRQSEGESHLLRDSARYPLCGRGDVNTYAVFAEGMRAMTAPKGRAGIIVPSGIATDYTTRFFFRRLVETRTLWSLFDFENKGLFPAIDSRVKFCLLTMSGLSYSIDEASFVFFAHVVGDLINEEKRFTLSAEDLALLNPNTRTCPIFGSRRDAEITKAAYRRVGVFIDDAREDGNPWGASFLRMFDMANDSGLFRNRGELESEGWALEGNFFKRGDDRYMPLYEAKMATFYDHRAADVGLSASAVTRQRQPIYLDEGEHADPARFAQPHSWVASIEVDTRLGDQAGTKWLIGWSDITSPTNARTLVPTAFPRVGAGDSLLLLLSSQPPLLRAALLANLSSLALDFLARQKVGGIHLKYFIMKQLPIFPPAEFLARASWTGQQSIAEWIGHRVLELTYTAWDMQGLAVELGYPGPPFEWNQTRRRTLRADLDAAFFHLYGLSRDEVAHVLTTFPIVERNDLRTTGRYATAEETLSAWDALNAARPVVSSR